MLDAAVSPKQRSLPAEIPQATELMRRSPATRRTTGRAWLPRPRTATSAMRHRSTRRTRRRACGQTRGRVQRRVQPPRKPRWLSQISPESQSPRVGGSSPSSGTPSRPRSSGAFGFPEPFWPRTRRDPTRSRLGRRLLDARAARARRRACDCTSPPVRPEASSSRRRASFSPWSERWHGRRRARSASLVTAPGPGSPTRAACAMTGRTNGRTSAGWRRTATSRCPPTTT